MRENGLKAPDVHRDRDKQDQCPTGQGSQTPVDTHVPQRAPEDPLRYLRRQPWKTARAHDES